MPQRRLLSLVSMATLLLSLVAGVGAPAPARAAVDLSLCGKVSAYVPATALTSGLLTVGGVPLVVSAGTSLSTKVAVGADICLRIDLDGLGRIKAATVSANVKSTITLCGVIAAYEKATATASGLITIGKRTLTLAPGSSLPSVVKAGANLCLRLKLNGLAQVTGGTAVVNVTTSLELCGTITAHARATGTNTGLLAIGGRSFVTAVGSQLPASVVAGADLCLNLVLNALGQVQSGTASLDARSAVEVCGQVSGLVVATNASNGSLTIAGLRYVVRAGTELTAAVRVGAFLKLRLSVDALGRVADAVVLKVGTSLADACEAAAEPTSGAGPSGGNGNPEPSPSAGNGGPAGGAASPGPTASVLPGTVTNPNSPLGERDTSPGAQGAGTGGGIVPDTASLGRTATVLALSAVPLLIMLSGVAAWVLANRRRQSLGDRGGAL
jgi:hypothetical protein